MPPVRATLGAAVRAVVCAWCAQAAGGLGPAAAQAPEAGHGEGAAELCAVGALLLRDCTAAAAAALAAAAAEPGALPSATGASSELVVCAELAGALVGEAFAGGPQCSVCPEACALALVLQAAGTAFATVAVCSQTLLMLLQAYQRLHQAGIEPDWAGGSLDGDLRGFIDARRSHCGIARQRELSSVVLPPSGSNTRHPLDVAHPALVGAGATRQVAILLAATPSMLRVYQPFINLWRCYALRHGLQFILETDDTEVRPPHRRAKNWIRWFAVRRHLDFYEALLVVDPDTFVVPECWNVSIPAVLGSTAAARRGQHASPDVGMRDFGRPQTLNNGVVLVRSTPRGRFFLDQLLAKAAWMQTIEKDQGAFDETVLEVLGLEALSRGEDGYDSECVQHVFPNARGNHEVALYALCWWRVSERLAGPFGARLSDTIRFADPRLADVNHVVGARGMSEPAVLHHFAGRSKDWDAMLDAFGVPPRQTMDCHAVHEHVHAAGAARLCVPGAAEVAECEDGLLVC